MTQGYPIIFNGDHAEFWRDRPGCANGMPGHPPCRSVAELEAMLWVRETTKGNV